MWKLPTTTVAFRQADHIVSAGGFSTGAFDFHVSLLSEKGTAVSG
jgi:molybdopterin biosynthesis enzyme